MWVYHDSPWEPIIVSASFFYHLFLFHSYSIHMLFVTSLSLLLLVFLCYLIKGTVQYPLTYNDDINNYHNGQSEKSCQLMDGFSVLVQLCLAFTALLTLIYKRSKESPQRPMQIWCVINVICRDDTRVTLIFAYLYL